MNRKSLLAMIVCIPFLGTAWAADYDSASDREDAAIEQERQEAGDRMRSWEERMREIGRQTDQLSEEARERLGRAWEDTQTQWGRLQNSSKEQWDKAQSRMNDAMNRLERAWEAATEEREE